MDGGLLPHSAHPWKEGNLHSLVLWELSCTFVHLSDYTTKFHVTQETFSELQAEYHPDKYYKLIQESEFLSFHPK